MNNSNIMIKNRFIWILFQINTNLNRKLLQAYFTTSLHRWKQINIVANDQRETNTYFLPLIRRNLLIIWLDATFQIHIKSSAVQVFKKLLVMKPHYVTANKWKYWHRVWFFIFHKWIIPFELFVFIYIRFFQRLFPKMEIIASRNNIWK